MFVVCDLDDKCLKTFLQELYAVLNACNSGPETRFCIAVEEGEAWLLGDTPAVKAAYPMAKDRVLNQLCERLDMRRPGIFGRRDIQRRLSRAFRQRLAGGWR